MVSNPRRLAIRRCDRVAIYDTGEHRISGVSQQQGNTDSVAFTSQRGALDLTSLRRLDPDPTAHTGAAPVDEASLEAARQPDPRAVFAHHEMQAKAGSVGPTEILDILAKLAELHAKGGVDGPRVPIEESGTTPSSLGKGGGASGFASALQPRHR